MEEQEKLEIRESLYGEATDEAVVFEVHQQEEVCVNGKWEVRNVMVFREPKYVPNCEHITVIIPWTLTRWEALHSLRMVYELVKLQGLVAELSQYEDDAWPEDQDGEPRDSWIKRTDVMGLPVAEEEAEKIRRQLPDLTADSTLHT